MVCAFCGTSISEGGTYCSGCGKPVTVAPASQSVVVEIYPNAPTPEAAPELAAEPTLEFSQGGNGTLLATANLCRIRKQWPEAIDHCVSVLKSAPADAAAHSLLGDIYRDQGKLEEAARWYRMALNLRDNAFDKAHLSRAEQELKRRNAAAAATTGATLARNNPAQTGTGNAHAAPDQQMWLKGITAASVVFLLGFVVYLRFAPVKGVDTHTASRVPIVASESQVGPDGLPPPRVGGPAVLPPGETAKTRTPEHVAGTGLSPDNSSLTMPTDTSHAQNSLAPAPVQKVSPLDNSAPPAPPAGASTWHSTSLTDGIQVSHVDAGRGSAAVYLFAPSGMDVKTKQGPLVRNLMRAARTVMENDATLGFTTVVITSGSKDGPVMMSGQVDRDTALSTDPDRESVDTLTGRIKIQ